MKYCFVPLLSVLLLVSCKPCVSNIACSPGRIFIYSKDYLAHDLDTLIIKKYIRDNGFTTLVDSIYYIGYGHKLTDSADGYVSIVDGYDYEIIAPVVNKIFTVYNITNMGMYEYSEKFSCGSEPTTKGCTNYVASLYIDGKKIEKGTISYAGNMILELTK